MAKAKMTKRQATRLYRRECERLERAPYGDTYIDEYADILVEAEAVGADVTIGRLMASIGNGNRCRYAFDYAE